MRGEKFEIAVDNDRAEGAQSIPPTIWKGNLTMLLGGLGEAMVWLSRCPMADCSENRSTESDGRLAGDTAVLGLKVKAK